MVNVNIGKINMKCYVDGRYDVKVLIACILYAKKL